MMVGGGILAILGIGCSLTLQSMTPAMPFDDVEFAFTGERNRQWWSRFGDIENPIKWALLPGALLFLPGLFLAAVGYFRM